MDADALEHLIVRVDFKVMSHGCGYHWNILYASGREELTSDAQHVQALLQSNHKGNRRIER